jgi:DNA-binding response OmpR family regulator
MGDVNLLEGKRVLIVDDEPDVLETLEELGRMCETEKATSFDQAKLLMESQPFDIAILDIMGVDGYKLLEIAREKEIIAVMLTAHAFSLQDTVKSYQEGAASYIPKDKMGEITTYLNDILEARRRGKHPWWRWLERFGSYYERTFGSEWITYEEFWKRTLKDKYNPG